MKLGIAIPLKSKKISKDWNVTCNALYATVKSILNQDDPNFIVNIAGHDKPEFLDSINDERVRFINVDYPAPDRNAVGFTTKELINDKNLKIITALKALEGSAVEWIFQLDSDDLMRADFISSIKKLPKAPAYIIQGGYLFYQSANRVIETEELDNFCGSTVVVRADAFRLPDDVSLDKIHDVPWTKYRHMNIYKFFEGIQGGCYRTNEKLITYLLASGDNFSDRWRNSFIKKLKWKLKPYFKGKKLSEELKKSFSMEQ